jgi:anti-sigma factor RsiW
MKPTTHMDCEGTRFRLDDYLDGALPPDEMHALELHLAGCADCREEERALREIVEAAAALPEGMEPPRDLWPGISERIARRTSEVESRKYWLPVAAALLVGLGTAGFFWMTQRPAPGPQEALRPAPIATAIPVADRPAWQTADEEYVRATAALLAAVDDPARPLSPAAKETVRRNLATIDAALAQIRTALGADPGNAGLARMLGATHQKKVDTLQRVLRLSRI